MLNFIGYTADCHMKILGEELGEIGRWYIALPPLLLIGFLIGLFFLAAAGQSRLNAANERVHDSQLRQQALSEFIALLTDAESGQRGYLLTGEASYLQPYTEAVAKVEAALDRVREAYGGKDDSREFQELRILTGKKLGELEDVLALFKKRGSAPAVNVVRTDVGKRTMDEISQDHRRHAPRGRAGADRGHGAMAVGFPGVAMAVGRRSHSQYRLGAACDAVSSTATCAGARARPPTCAIRSRNWNSEVDERTRELTALSTHLQGVSEQEKSALSRELHDELGGLLVAARMDLSWLQQRLPTERSRHRTALQAHPRILERRRRSEAPGGRGTAAHPAGQHGLVRGSALAVQGNLPPRGTQVHGDHSGGGAEVQSRCRHRRVSHRPGSADEHPQARGGQSADLAIGIEGDTFTLRVSDDGKGIPANRLQTTTSHGLASMRHRIAALGGTLGCAQPEHRRHHRDRGDSAAENADVRTRPDAAPAAAAPHPLHLSRAARSRCRRLWPMTTSTRRFSCRPPESVLLATGNALP